MIRLLDRYRLFLAGLLVAAGVFYLAVPRSIAVFNALDGVQTANALVAGKYLLSEDLRKLAVSRAAALAWGENPVYTRDLARAYHRLSRRAPPGTRKSLQGAAHDISAREVRARPMNAVAWWRLGVMRAAIAGRPQAQSAAYLHRSILMQRNAMTLMPLRLRAVSDHWRQFDPAQRRDVRPQFAAAWRRDPKSVIRIAQNPHRRAVIRAALATDPRLLGAFEAALGK